MHRTPRALPMQRESDLAHVFGPSQKMSYITHNDLPLGFDHRTLAHERHARGLRHSTLGLSSSPDAKSRWAKRGKEGQDDRIRSCRGFRR